ncbi:dihydroxyacetone kinase transcriptional activator DhaS [Atopobacter sp. AH10]|uniref:dihydroxyacetone kinase transcriptional activator DhaS n=1 Tax=Atopobacter sp. AH10 TaxID=2315861 RepID=UPI000EF271C5|nr:dihydroxyacetone kinase transcriptional activator DhaS [Atopobacter sp. AH10]RLK63504.1 dihydroxyacetone kinase transcriptional activator DhaS [Atopobacter sp. AH10]
MLEGIITKKKIVKAFKDELKERDFDSISVSQLMKRSGIRRQTFYNYFVDKFELLEWTFLNDLNEQISDHLDYLSGVELLKELLYFFQQNQQFYGKLFRIVDQNDFTSYFCQYCEQLVGKIFREELAKRGLLIDESRLDGYISYHSLALSYMIQKQVVSGSFDEVELYQTCYNSLMASIDLLEEEEEA